MEQPQAQIVLERVCVVGIGDNPGAAALLTKFLSTPPDLNTFLMGLLLPRFERPHVYPFQDEKGDFVMREGADRVICSVHAIFIVASPRRRREIFEKLVSVGSVASCKFTLPPNNG